MAPEPVEEKKVISPVKKLMKYMKNESLLFFIGSIALLGGTVGELVNPYYIGMFVDNLKNENYDKVYTLCWQLALIVLVILSNNYFPFLFLGLIVLCLSERISL